MSICPRIDQSDPSLLTRIDRVNQDLLTGSNSEEATWNFVDNDVNFRYRDGTVDGSLLLRDGIHLSYVGCTKLLVNAGLSDVYSVKRKMGNKNNNNNSNNNIARRNPKHTVRASTHGRGSNSFTNSRRRPFQSYSSHDVLCHFCGENGHVSTVCRHGAPIRCWSCGLSGHKSHVCPR